MTLRPWTCGKCGKETCNHKQPAWGEMWLNGEIVSMETRQPIRRRASSESTSKRLGTELQKLHALFMAGALSQEEFNQAKKRLIGD
jgi:hypothetical protein